VETNLVTYNVPADVCLLAVTGERPSVVHADGAEIGSALLSNRASGAQTPPDLATIVVSLQGGLKVMERAIVKEVVCRCHGNKAAAARALGLHRRTLYRLLE
jgi:ActR/RegA family two-component response regulator